MSKYELAAEILAAYSAALATVEIVIDIIDRRR